MALVTVGRFRDPVQAQLRKGLLEGAGIPAFVADEHLIGTQWLYSTALGGARLQVPSQYEEAARNLLAEDAAGSLEALSENSLPLGDGDACPRCGSGEVRPSHTKRSALAFSLLVELPLFVWRRRWVCGHCGHTWRVAGARRVVLQPSTLDAESEVREGPGSYAMVAALLGAIVAILFVRYVLG